MHTINAHLLVRQAALGMRKNESTENAREGMREETTVNFIPTEAVSVIKGEKARDFRHQQQDIDDYKLSRARPTSSGEYDYTRPRSTRMRVVMCWERVSTGSE